MKKAAKTATRKALQKAATKTGEYAGEKAVDKIIQLLSKKNKNTKTPVATSPIKNPQSRELSDNVIYYIHFEITGYPCNLIGSQQCDLSLNRIIFCFKSHLFQIVSFMF